jgi:serine/threonine-protein kinase
MDDVDVKVLERRMTHLGLARTLAPDVTIRDSRAADTTLAQSREVGGAAAKNLPHIAFDINRSQPIEPVRTPDLAIVSTIGEGGMGRVHLARQRSLDRDVAVKTLKDDAAPAASAALFREARLTGSLEHPGVIPVHALGVDEKGGPLLVMKRVEGVDWATLLEDDAHPKWSLLTASGDRLAANLEILTQVCRTVEFAHSRGIIHRDIKPENVMVGSYGEVYLVDWGIATASKAPRPDEGLVGTPAYMAPEMFLGNPVDERTDVYLLAATLHQVLTGTFRHEGSELMYVLQSSLLSNPVKYDDGVPDFLASLCNTATSREPDARPQSARAFRDQLAEFMHRRSSMALSDAAAERLATLRAQLDGAKDEAPPADLALAYRLATEARFGFTESLREHPTSLQASAGLRASMMALIELELRQEHADTAEALLREIHEPHPTITSRVQAIRERDEKRRREAQRLEAIDHDLDPTVEALPRALAMGMLILMSAAISVVAFAMADLNPRTLLFYGVLFCSATGLGVFALRKRLFTNAYNRKLTWMLLACSGMILLQRLIGFIFDVDARLTFAANLWLEALTIISAAIAFQPRLWMALPPILVGAMLSPAFPHHVPGIFVGSTMITFALIGFALWPKSGRR